MPDFLDSLPFWIAFTFLFFGAMMRGQMMFWLGRIVSKAALDRITSPRIERIRTWVNSGGADSGIRALDRWGVVMVPLSYLTVGFQSVVQLSAGLLQMHPVLYTLAQIPGALAWAGIYSTIGFAAWGAIVSAAAGSPSALIVVSLVAIVVIYLAVRRRRLRTSSNLTDEDPLDDPSPLAEAGPAHELGRTEGTG